MQASGLGWVRSWSRSKSKDLHVMLVFSVHDVQAKIVCDLSFGQPESTRMGFMQKLDIEYGSAWRVERLPEAILGEPSW